MADPIFIVKFERGLADRHRLPLAHVLSVLDEVRQMIVSVGKDIQHRRGISEPTGDFGLEILAGRDGLVLKKGSLQARIAITRDIQDGLIAAGSVLSTVQKLTRARGSLTAEAKLKDPLEHKIVRHLDRIARIQSGDKTETRFAIKQTTNGADTAPHTKTISALLGESAIQSIKTARQPAFATDKVTLFGRLFELKDRNQDRDGRRFWGELRLDNGDVWRVQFDSEKQSDVAELFRKQVQITGRAYYYEAYPPKIVPEEIVLDEERDYEAAFDELYGSANLNADFATLLKEMHGE